MLSGNAGYCEEQEWIDLSTVKGYCRTVMCQEVRDELEANLPQPDSSPKDDQQDEQEEEEWQRILIAMCDGRLLPTPWLNKVIPFASYLCICLYYSCTVTSSTALHLDANILLWNQKCLCFDRLALKSAYAVICWLHI